MNHPGNQRRTVARLVTAIFFIVAGANHFWHTGFYVRITPPVFPHRLGLVWISGFFEIAGGAGLLVQSLWRAASRGLILLLLAVFPANVYMAVDADRFADLGLPAWVSWLRLPLQGVLIAWVWWIGRDGKPSVRAGDHRDIS
jgi:uncharacterized membrane protein